MAYEEILLIDWAKYDRNIGVSYWDEEIPVEKIVGTNGKYGGKGYRWADILAGNKFDLSQWNSRKIDQILTYDAANIFLIKDVHKGEYYIHSEGHHRVPFWKCVGKEEIAAKVSDIYLLKAETYFSGHLPEPKVKRTFLTRVFGVFRRSEFDD